MKDKLLRIWDQQTERDKSFLIIGGVVVLFYLFYAIAYSPLNTSVETYQQQLHEDKVTLAWMKSVESLAKPQEKVAEKVSSNQFLSLMSDALHQTVFKGYTYQLQQVGEHDIQLYYDAVPYNFFLVWLSNYSKKYQFVIKRLQVQKLDKPGIVKLTMVVEVPSV